MSISIRMENKVIRHERKFRIEGISAASVRQTVRLLPWGLRTLFPDRRIHNIYFDTPDLAAFHENMAGVGERRKYRIRWYGEADWPEGDVMLEIKERMMDQGMKRSIPIVAGGRGDLPFLMTQLFSLPGIPGALRPVLANSYLRSYFGAFNGAVRISLDTALAYRSMISPTLRAEDSAIILEVKYDMEREDDILPVLQGLPFRISRNSKYAKGVELLHGR